MYTDLLLLAIDAKWPQSSYELTKYIHSLAAHPTTFGMCDHHHLAMASGHSASNRTVAMYKFIHSWQLYGGREGPFTFRFST